MVVRNCRVPPRRIMNRRIQLTLLGEFHLKCDGVEISAIGTTRMRSLLAYLVLHRGSLQSRASLAFLFWPDSSEPQALTNLRHLLYELRQVLPDTDGCLHADTRTVEWKSDAPCDLDVTDFKRTLAVAHEAIQRGDRAAARVALEQAVLVYKGDLLPGFDGDWIASEREQLRQEYGTALERLVALREDARDYAAAIRHAERLRLFDPTRETTSCTLMRLHLLSGDRARSLQTYQECVSILERELSVGPGKLLRQLREQALADVSGNGSHSTERLENQGPEFSLRGRDPEWRALRAAWSEAATGRAAMVALIGEAGIGKTRLAEELCGWVERQGAAAARTRSYAAEGRLAYAPAAQWLRSAALKPQLTLLDPVWLAEVARIIPEIRLEHPKLQGVAGTEESGQRHRLFEALSRAMLARGGSLLLWLDDIQWTDRETLEWLRYLMRFAPAAPFLVVVGVRSDELRSQEPLQNLFADLRRDDQLTEIELSPLSESEVAAVACDVAGRELNQAERELLFVQTEGNPLFVVESVRAGCGTQSEDQVREPSRAPAVIGIQIPPKVHAVISTRLAQLTTAARDLAGVAAVLGRAFTFETLVAVSERLEAELVAAIEELWDRRIVRELANGAYDFTHDKLREVAYGGIISPRRRMLHRRAAEALEKIHAGEPDVVRAQLAAHLAESGPTVAAIAAYQRAADAAKRLNASEEAIRLFQKALGLLTQQPGSPARAVQELELNTELGVCLVASRGYPASDVWHVYERALDLCRQLQRPTAPPILRGLALASVVIGDLKRAYTLGEELLGLYDHQRDPVLAVEGHYVLGVTCHWLGRFTEARSHFERGLAAYDPKCHDVHVSHYAQDPKAVCLCRLAWTFWYLGCAQRAIATMAEALAFVQTIKHPHTEGYVLYFGAQLSYDLRDDVRAGEFLNALERLTARHHLIYWEHRGQVLSGFLRANRTRSSDCGAAARQAMAAFALNNDVLNLTQTFGYAAHLHWRHGRVADGRAAIADAFALIERTDERYYSAELHRLDGELLRAGKASEDVSEGAFQQALLIARQQGAKFFELRAALSLGRLWQRQGKTAPARTLVESVYLSFDDQSATADREDARALLDDLKPRKRNAVSS